MKGHTVALRLGRDATPGHFYYCAGIKLRAVHFSTLSPNGNTLPLPPVVSFRVLLIIAFYFLTAPVAVHMIARAAYFVGVPLWGEA